MIQREYFFWNLKDLNLIEYWIFRMMAEERRRCDAMMNHYREEWMKQEKKMDFRNYLLFIDELEEYR